MSTGLILYRGPSLIDGAPIVVIATGLDAPSRNAKTGAMVQTYILRSDVAPTEAIKAGTDSSICGDCPHRGNRNGTGRTCYVNVGQGPLAVFRAFQRGTYADAANLSEIRRAGLRRVIRLGTYGDPAAVPAHIWRAFTDKCVAHTGYTHQWRKSADLRELCMASADSESDALEARAHGWRTFRVALPCDAARMDGEAICPASAEAGKKLTCAACTACHGTSRGRRGSIVIQAHGGAAVMANVRRKVALAQSLHL